MANIFTKGIAKIFGTKSDKDIKAVQPYVEETNKIFATLSGLSNDELRSKTDDVRSRINEFLKSIDDQLAEAYTSLAATYSNHYWEWETGDQNYANI